MKNNYKFLSFCSIFLALLANHAIAQTTTYSYTGSVQTFVCTTGVTLLSVDVRGAQGGSYPLEGTGGSGGRVQCTLAVTSGEVLYIYVGQQGTAGACCGGPIPPGGSNSGGGADGGAGSNSDGGSAGGAASDIRTVSGATAAALSSRIVVGGGGGGGAFDCGLDDGGAGGNATGGTGIDCTGYSAANEGTPGTPTAGGAPAASGGTAGTFGLGGDAYPTFWGGGGGGGWFGAGGAYQGGGCGGSSYVGTGTSAVTMTSGYQTGDGEVIITVLCTTPVGGAITGSPVVCQGSSTTLSDPTGTPGGTWSSSAPGIATVGSSSGTVYGVAPGTVTITYSIVLSCGTASATTVMTVNPVPGAIFGPGSVCVGSSISLFDTSIGGSWSSSAPSVASVDPAAGIVTGMSAGTSSIAYTLSTGCRSTATVTVNAAPVAISGPTSVCMGSTITLTESATGGAWSSSAPSVATVGSATGVVTPVSPGPVTIIYANGCGAPATSSIMVNPLPAPITGTTSVCQGATTTLSDATFGGTWSSLSPSTASIDAGTGVVTGMAGGTTFIYYTLPTGCDVSTLVTVIPPLAPITGIMHVCVGQTTTLFATPGGGTWTSASGSIATIGSTGIVTGASMGVTEIIYTAGAGCSATTFVTVNPLAPILGTDSVCVGLSTYLTDIVGGGIWSSSTMSVATITFDSGKVSGITPGTTTIHYLLPTGCLATTNFHVIAYPPPSVIGFGPLCPGTSINLSNSVTGGAWSTANSEIATVSGTGAVTGIAADTVSISYTISPGCRVTTLVTIHPNPAPITGDGRLCPGTTDTLRDPDAGGAWSSATAALVTVDTSGVVTALPATSGGNAIISYTFPTGCASIKTLSVNPSPVPIVTFNWMTNTFVTQTPPYWVRYQWYDSIVGKIAGATSPTVAAANTDYYYVIVTDSNGCMGASALMYYNIGEAGVKTAPGRVAATVYPNPSTGILNIVCAVKVRAVVSDIEGRTLISKDDAQEVDVSSLADGVYMIALLDADNNLVTLQKFVKQ